MATWEYAFLYRIQVFDRNPQSHETSMVFVIEDSEGLRIIEEVSSLLVALNRLGADNWLIQLPASFNVDNYHPAANLVDRTLENFKTGASGWGYYMRRSRD